MFLIDTYIINMIEITVIVCYNILKSITRRTDMRKTALIAAAMIAANLLFSALPASADDISIVVDGKTLETPSPAVIVNDRTLVPLRAVSQSLGFDVAWDDETQGITITDGDVLFFMWIGQDHAFRTSPIALDRYVIMETPPVIMNDYTMVPLRAVSEMFDAEVGWDQSTQTVSVSFGRDIQVYDQLASQFIDFEQDFSKNYNVYKALCDGTLRTVNAEIQLESGGVIELALFPDIAPLTVANFAELANEHFYDGLIFHRVIKDFMIQGGGYDTNYVQKHADPIPGEFITNRHFNLLGHSEGVISMARTMTSGDSATSQFFIMHKDYHSLDGRYAAFGVVTKGMEFVDQIALTPTDYSYELKAEDVPILQQVIKTIVIK